MRDVFNDWCAGYADRTALLDARRSLTYRELDAQSTNLALNLLDLGLIQGRRSGPGLVVCCCGSRGLSRATGGCGVCQRRVAAWFLRLCLVLFAPASASAQQRADAQSTDYARSYHVESLPEETEKLTIRAPYRVFFGFESMLLYAFQVPSGCASRVL